MEAKGVARIRPFDELEEKYFLEHPEEIDEYIHILFEGCVEDGNLRPLLSSLRVLCRVRGLTRIADEAGMSRRGVQKALSDTGNPEFGTVLAILRSLGYKLVPQKIEHAQPIIGGYSHTPEIVAPQPEQRPSRRPAT